MEVISPEAMAALLHEGALLVHREVLGHSYGISSLSVRKLQAAGKLVLLDVDQVEDAVKLKEAGFQVGARVGCMHPKRCAARTGRRQGGNKAMQISRQHCSKGQPTNGMHPALAVQATYIFLGPADLQQLRQWLVAELSSQQQPAAAQEDGGSGSGSSSPQRASPRELLEALLATSEQEMRAAEAAAGVWDGRVANSPQVRGLRCTWCTVAAASQPSGPPVT